MGLTPPVDTSILHEIVRIIEARRKVPERLVVRGREYQITYLEDHQRRLEEALQRFDHDRLNMLYGQLASKVKYQMLRRVPTHPAPAKAAAKATPKAAPKVAPKVSKRARPAARPAKAKKSAPARTKRAAKTRPAAKAAPRAKSKTAKTGRPQGKKTAARQGRAARKGAAKKK